MTPELALIAISSAGGQLQAMNFAPRSRPVRERIIATELLKLEQRRANKDVPKDAPKPKRPAPPR